MIIKSVSGIRGIVGQGIDPLTVLKFAAHFGEFLGGGKIIVGRDSRTSGLTLKKAVISGLLGVGVDAIDIGIIPTPTLLYNVKNSEASGGIVITASHNPSQWNALKLVTTFGEFLGKNEAEEFFSYEERKINWRASNKLGKVIRKEDAIKNHIEGVLSSELINPAEIKNRKFNIVIDCVNGGASFAYPKFLKTLDAKVDSIFCNPDGKFPRNPEPRGENLESLCKKVKEVGGDVGFATDPDGDRISIVSDKGEPLGEENTIVLATNAVLKKKKGPVVVNLSTTKSVEVIAKRAGVPLYRAPVGEANVVWMMKKKRAVIGGEGNGGVINPTIQYTRDGMATMALILQYLTEEDKPLSQIMNKMPRYKMIKEEIRIEDREDGRKFIQRVKNANKDKKLVLQDGVKIIEEDRWVHVRMSGTEPVIRIIAEGPTLESARELSMKAKKQGRK